MEILGLIVAALVIGAIVAFVRLLLLPGEVRELRDTVTRLEVELRAMRSRLDTARDRIERIETAAPAEARPRPDEAHADHERVVEEEEPLDEEIEEITAEARPIAPLYAAAAEGPPPLPTERDDHEPPSLPTQERVRAPQIDYDDYEPILSSVGKWLKSLGPKDPNMTWEMALGTYWLPRLGALAISAAIVFLLTLAFQKWGAGARVLMGYGVSGALLGAGWWLDRNYPRYARVLFGAGFALTYFVTFGTHFIPFARIFDTPYLSLAGQAAIVVMWAAMAQRRKSQVIAGIAVLMGHFTIALATYSIAAPGPYSVAGIAFLSAGGAFFLARNGWYAVAGLGLLASYANHFYLMTQVESRGTVSEFVVGMTVLSVYFLTFAVAELISPEDVRRKQVPFWFRNSFVTVNSVCLLLLGTAQMTAYDFTRDVPEMFYYALAAVLLVFCLAYLRLRAGDPLYNTYFVKGISAATLGLAFQFEAHTLTLSLALESLILLYAARRNGLMVTRIVAIAAAALAVGQGVMTLATTSAIAYSDPGYWTRAAEAGGVALAFLAASLLYQRTDWGARSPATSRFSAETRLALWQLDLIASPPQEYPTAQKPVGGLMMPYALAACGSALAAGFGLKLFTREDFALALAILALVLTLGAAALRSRPYGFASFVAGAAGAVMAANLLGAMTLGHLFGEGAIGMPLNRAIPMLACLAAVAVASEVKYLARFDGLALHQRREVAYVLYGVVAFLLALLIDIEAGSSTAVVVGSTIAAAVFFAGAIPLRREALSWCGVALLAWAALRWNDDWSNGSMRGFLASDWGVIALGLAADRYLRRIDVKFAGPATLVIATAAFAPYIYLETSSGWLAACWTAGAAFLLVYAAVFKTRTAAGLGVALLVAASVFDATLNTRDLQTALVILGFAAPAILWIAAERGLAKFAPGMKLPAPVAWISGAMAAIATVLLALMLFRLPQLSENYLAISWSALAVMLFGLVIAAREKSYGWCAIAVLVAASVYEVQLNPRVVSTFSLVTGFAAPSVLWIIAERALVRFAPRMKITAPLEPISGAMAAIATGLLVLMLYRLPQLAEFYLTISWSVLAVALFGVAVVARAKFYRWCGLAVLGLAFLRAGFIDTRQLEAIPRVFALGGLGFIALLLGFGYSRVFAKEDAARNSAD